MSNLNRCFMTLALGSAMVMTATGAAAQGETDSEETSRVTIDGAFTWMGTWGNDVFVAETITVDRRFVSGTTSLDENANPLVTEMKSTGVPWAQIGLERGKWGVSGEFWTLDTDGSTMTGDEAFEAFRYHDVTGLVDELEVDLQASNELSVWTVRAALTRALSKSLTLGVGLLAGELENRRNEALELEGFDSFFSQSGILTTRSKSTGTMVGPSVDLRGSATLGGRALVRFMTAQSVLFSRFDNETVWQSSITFDDFLFETMRSEERFAFDSSTRRAIPVTDARAILTFHIGGPVSVGVLGLLSVWFDAPLAFQFSQASDGWDPVSSTLVFASVGPTVTVSF